MQYAVHAKQTIAAPPMIKVYRINIAKPSSEVDRGSFWLRLLRFILTLTSELTGRAVPPKYSYLPTTFLAPRACGPVQRLVRADLPHLSEHHPCEIPPTRRLRGGRAEGVGGHFAVDDYAVHCLLCGRWPPPKHIFDSQDLTSELTGRAVPPL